MRIKFLSVIVSFLFVSLAISSCLDSDDSSYELSSDATVHAFGLDTIYGKHYTFTIDQLRRVIYNRDSLPIGADTIINHILIDTFTVSGWVTAGINDTIFDYTKDSVDFAPIVNKQEGMKFKVHAPDGTYREYTVQINRHNQDPDSLVWKEMEVYSENKIAGKQRAVILNNDLWVYTNTNQAYKTSTEAGRYGWQPVNLIDYPSDADPESVVNFKKKVNSLTNEVSQILYIVTEGKKVYQSIDGETWAEVTALGNNIEALIASLTGTLTGITSEGYFCTSNDGETWNRNDKDEIILTEVPQDFPRKNIYAAQFSTSNSMPQVMVIGTPSASAKLTIPWFHMEGDGWADMSSTSYDAYCPVMPNPAGMYYGGKFYIFGSKEVNKLDAIYSSITGIAWYKTEKKFLLPEDFEKITSPYSITIDNQNYIWVIFGGDLKANAVWRGRLNRLGFDIQ